MDAWYILRIDPVNGDERVMFHLGLFTMEHAAIEMVTNKLRGGEWMRMNDELTYVRNFDRWQYKVLKTYINNP